VRKISVFLGFFFLFLTSFGQSSEKVWMHPNKGQWEDIILQKVDLTNGDLFLTRKGMTFHFNNAAELSHHHQDTGTVDHDEDLLQGQVIDYNFLGAGFQGVTNDEKPAGFYENYYIGNDPTKWKSEIYAIEKSTLPSFLPGVKMVYESEVGALKYSFVLAPNVNPNSIQAEISGADKITILKNGKLNIQHRFGIIHESKPVAWQMNGDEKVIIDVEFVLNGTILSYSLGNYDVTKSLIIDPSLTFSTFSGSTADNWGSTATPDALGNVFGGGIVFGGGFPTTVGAYDVTFNGTSSFNLNFDVAIMKFNGTGSSLMYSTYLGGATSNEFPSSMVCGPNGQLYVLGMTGSSDFPVLAGYDMTFNGGTSFTPQGGSGTIPGSDIFITRFNPNGTAILSSTYVGGSGNDGYNGALTLKYNYGDSYRGEITIDALYNVYVASSTTSFNFPTLGLGGQAMQGSQSAVAFKLNSTLSLMQWSRYISGNSTVAGYSIQVANNGNVFVAGGTTSTNMSLLSGEDLTYNGGNADGYVIRLNPISGQTVNGTYIGLAEYDQAFFVQTDVQGEPYILGQTESSYPITVGKYGNANSGQFIRKYTSNLSTILWTTMLGASSGHVELSPTAFLVSDCYDIYIAGWGGPLNANPSVSLANFSTVSGFPVTSDAYQSTTLGDNFYLAVLGGNAVGLKYATFFGGLTNTQKHVDGGTSRFDKGGRIYHSVCASCGSSTNGFTTTPGAWSTTDNSTNCNMAVFKFDLSVIVPLINVLDPLICYPDPVVFQNLTLYADMFSWTFGDGTSSTVQSPSHNYPGPGTYIVTLIASDSLGCYVADTSTYIIDIGDFQGGIVQPTDTICSGGSYQMQATGGGTYSWSPAFLLDNPSSATPIATVTTTTVFTVIVSDSCGADTLSATLYVWNDSTTISNDTSLCLGESVPLWVAGGVTYSWLPATYLDNPNSATPVCTPDTAITYTVTITSASGCVYTEQVFVNVFYDPPMPIIDDTVNVCRFTSEIVTVSGSDSYTWDPSAFITPLVGPVVDVSPLISQYFVCNFTNACGTVQDSIFAQVIIPDVSGFGDTTICPGETAVLSSSGGVSYEWLPHATFLTTNGSLVQVKPNVNTNYSVIGQDINGCYDTAFVLVQLFPQTTVSTDNKIYAIIGDIIELNANGNPPGGNYLWSPPEYLTCTNCATTEANPDSDFKYTIQYTDLNGCTAVGGVRLAYDASVYVPNTFTPDGDAFNGIFSVVPVNVKIFKLDIYNRWGQLIHVMTESTNFWDGTFNGRKSPDGVYTWKMIYRDQYEQPHLLTGHVSLIR
jgi:gliding motility-associated-like protein